MKELSLGLSLQSTLVIGVQGQRGVCAEEVWGALHSLWHPVLLRPLPCPILVRCPHGMAVDLCLPCSRM